MAYAHAPLEDAQLGPIAARMVGANAPGPMRKMVAQGLAPLPPKDMVIALYQIWVTNDPDLSEVAAKTVSGLPESTLKGAIDDRTLPAGVLDFLGRKLLRQGELLDAIARHPNVDDQSLVGIARVCPDIVCDTLARAENRWLRTPAIVASLYQNRNCPMSVIHRMLELAEREGVEIKMVGMEEIRAAFREDKADGVVYDEASDEVFAEVFAPDEGDQAELIEEFAAAGVDDELDLPELGDEFEAEGDDLGDALAGPGDEVAETAEAEPEPEPEPAGPDYEAETKKRENRLQQLLKMNPSEKVRAALLGDKSDRAVLIRDSNKVVAMSAAKSPKVTDSEAVNWSANRSLSPEVIRYIANRREWIKLYTVKYNLVMNPKTPMVRSMSLMAYLSRADLAKVARSKSIPSALAKAAKRKVGGGR